ncbi:MAG: hypothetical protein JST84_29070 [Acidobacteria bacterium]|nr:hypothetical protein [Acidobacteriota bacterium]
MKIKALFLSVVLSLSFSALAQTNPEPKKEEPRKFQVKMLEVKYRNPQVLTSALRTLSSGIGGSEISSNVELKTITVRDYPENIAAIEEALKKLDQPEAAPTSLQIQMYLIQATSEVTDKASFPKDMDPVLTQLQATLKYKGYRFLNTYISRVNDGGSVQSSGMGDPKLSLSTQTPAFLSYQMNNVRLATDLSGKEAIRIGKFNFNARIPIVVGSGGNIQYQDIGLNTELSTREGEMAVVGTTDLGTTDGAFIVVINVKKLR